MSSQLYAERVMDLKKEVESKFSGRLLDIAAIPRICFECPDNQKRNSLQCQECRMVNSQNKGFEYPVVVATLSYH